MTGRSERSIYTGVTAERSPDQLSECRLWKAVISQAIYDASLTDKRRREEVREWLDTPDFGVVCALAMLDDDAVRKEIQTTLAAEPADQLYRRKRFKKFYRSNAN
jgi:hypothetical protein